MQGFAYELKAEDETPRERRRRRKSLWYIRKGRLDGAPFDGSGDVTLTEPGLVWDEVVVFQGHRVNAPYIRIGRKERKPRRLKVIKHANPIKQALCFRELLDSGQADSQGDLSRRCGIPRTTITAFVRLLGLDAEVQAQILQLGENDPRLQRLTEARLRGLHGQSASVQQEIFTKLLRGAPAVSTTGKTS